jgi:hypothetical protein
MITHRGETRGLGGIFFDDLNDRDPSTILGFSTECVNSVVGAARARARGAAAAVAVAVIVAVANAPLPSLSFSSLACPAVEKPVLELSTSELAGAACGHVWRCARGTRRAETGQRQSGADRATN